MSRLDSLGWGDTGKPATPVNDAASQRAGRAALVKPFELRSVVRVAFRKPVGVIFGANDPHLKAGVAKAFHRLFAGSRLHLLAGAGHGVPMGAAEQASGVTQAGVGAR